MSVSRLSVQWGFVPQRRERIFIVGFKERSEFVFPESPAGKTKLGDILQEKVDAKYTLNDHLLNYHQERKWAQKRRRETDSATEFSRPRILK